MPSQWRYLAERLNGDGTGTLIHLDVPLQGVEIEEVLSGVNGLNAKIAPEHMTLKDSFGEPIFNEWSTAIYAEKDDEIRGAGILVHSGFDGSSWNLECAGFVGYLNGMPYTGAGKFFVDTDTLDIARYIWNHVQTQNRGNLGLILDGTKSGRRVGSTLASEEYDPEGGPGGLELESQAYKLTWYEDHDLFSNFNSLASDSPFDYAEKHQWAGDAIQHRLQFGVPRLGRRREDLRFVVGENVFTVPSVERRGDDYADEIYALGAGEGATMIRGHAIKLPRARLRRAAVISDTSMRRQAQADRAARAELQSRSRLDSIQSVTAIDHPHAPVGSLTVGDEILIEGDAGWKQLSTWCRVVSQTIRPEDPGATGLTLVPSDRLI